MEPCAGTPCGTSTRRRWPFWGSACSREPEPSLITGPRRLTFRGWLVHSAFSLSRLDSPLCRNSARVPRECHCRRYRRRRRMNRYGTSVDHVAAVSEPLAPRASELVTADAAPDHRPFPLLRTTTPLMTGQSVVLAAAPSRVVHVRPLRHRPAISGCLSLWLSVRCQAPERPPRCNWAPRRRQTGFSGALKKTGASIVKGGAATGASIADAFRSVFGAFKKVSPFAPDIQIARAGLN